VKKEKIAVLGSGNGARAVCAQIGFRGYDVVMWEPLEETDDYKRLKQEKRVLLSGDIILEGKIKEVTMDIAEAIKDAVTIFVVVPAFAHEPIFKKMIPHLKSGQHIVIMPGNYGCFKLRKMLNDKGLDLDISITETASLPYACRITSYNEVRVFKKKDKLHMATSPCSCFKQIFNLLQDIFNPYVEMLECDKILNIDLSNSNFTLHPLPVLLNYGAIEQNPKTFRHYIDGITPEISKLMKKMDDERLAIGKAYGIDLLDTLEQLKIYYGWNDSTSYYEYVHSPESPYYDLIGHNIKSRYLTEDVPQVLVPAYLLAKKADLNVPVVEITIRLASYLHGVDYLKEGTTLAKLGFDKLSVEEISNFV